MFGIATMEDSVNKFKKVSLELQQVGINFSNFKELLTSFYTPFQKVGGTIEQFAKGTSVIVTDFLNKAINNLGQGARDFYRTGKGVMDLMRTIYTEASKLDILTMLGLKMARGGATGPFFEEYSKSLKDYGTMGPLQRWAAEMLTYLKVGLKPEQISLMYATSNPELAQMINITGKGFGGIMNAIIDGKTTTSKYSDKIHELEKLMVAREDPINTIVRVLNNLYMQVEKIGSWMAKGLFNVMFGR
jgi:hypothetical protein